MIGNGPEIRDFPPARPLDPSVVEKAADHADVLAIYALDTSSPLLESIARMGFRESSRFHRDASKEVILYRRVSSQAGKRRAGQRPASELSTLNSRLDLP